MVSIFRYTEISESDHRILNPLSEDRLPLLAQICDLRPGVRQLDLACGKGEMLCQWAAAHGVTGVGVDIHPPFVEQATARAVELGVDGAVEFQRGDAGAYQAPPASFDVVSCIGATWIGGGLLGTLASMRRLVRPDGWLLVGEPYWIEEAPPDVQARHQSLQSFADLGGTLDRFESAGVDLVEMVVADQASWDRYSASQWRNVDRWVRDHPEHPDAAEVLAFRDDTRRHYLHGDRRYLGWAVFVLRPAPPATTPNTSPD